ncbi:MAG: non-ribosomal peptide synthetase, partial [bacterium]|nr:non-ribosomal peptide synthetase [bacterium]
YRDFSQWQHLRVRVGEIKKQEAYWHEVFEGEVPQLTLPLDYPRPEIQSFEGNYEVFEADKIETLRIKELAVEKGVTLFMVMLAVYNVFLYKISGQEDIIVGTVASGRNHTDLEGIIGMFVNTLALRNYPCGDKTFARFLEDVRKRTLDAFDNQDYQFDELVETLRLRRDPSRNPLFDTMFTFVASTQPSLVDSNETHAKGTSHQQDLQVSAYEREGGQAKFDLILEVRDRGKRFGFVVYYRTGLFKAETVQRFVKYFKEVLAAVAEDKTVKLEEIAVTHELHTTEANVYKNVADDFEF